MLLPSFRDKHAIVVDRTDDVAIPPRDDRTPLLRHPLWCWKNPMYCTYLISERGMIKKTTRSFLNSSK